jgi:hypothetical protein
MGKTGTRTARPRGEKGRDSRPAAQSDTDPIVLPPTDAALQDAFSEAFKEARGTVDASLKLGV